MPPDRSYRGGRRPHAAPAAPTARRSNALDPEDCLSQCKSIRNAVFKAKDEAEDAVQDSTQLKKEAATMAQAAKESLVLMHGVRKDVEAAAQDVQHNAEFVNAFKCEVDELSEKNKKLEDKVAQLQKDIVALKEAVGNQMQT